MTLTNLPIISNDAGLVRYLEEINKFPVLSEQEELELAIAWYNNQDIIAAQKLASSHLRLVAKIAKQYRGYGLPIVDLISEGNIGLMTAVKKFDPYKGNRLSTYAILWIKAMIQDYILKSWSMVKMGTSAVHKKLFFNLRKVKNRIVHANNGIIPYNETELIAKELEVSEADVREMNDRFNQYEESLNDHTYEDGVEKIDTIASPEISHDIKLLDRDYYDYKKRKFKLAFAKLNPREQAIISARKLSEDPKTLQELSSELNVSMERVRQIESTALQKLCKLVNAEFD